MLPTKTLTAKLCALLLAVSMPALAAPATTTWNGLASNNNLLDPSNWTDGVPNTSREAIFNSAVFAINDQPTAVGNFNVGELNFPHQANPFTFEINEGHFSLSSITGTNTNTTININNIDKLPPNLNQQILFHSDPCSSGNANITLINSGSLSDGSTGAPNSLLEQYQFQANGSYSIGDGATITMTNSGSDSTTGIGGNNVGYIGSTQMAMNYNISGPQYSFNAGDNVTINLHNSGTNSGQNTNTTSNYIGLVGNPQFNVFGPVQAGNNFTTFITNEGTDTSKGLGDNGIGLIDDSQLEFDDTTTVGNHATFTATNTGTNSCSGTKSSVGYVSGAQFDFEGLFQAGNFLKITATNQGTDTSTGGGENAIGQINYQQIAFDNSVEVGNNASFTASNSGTCSSESNHSTIGYISNSQIGIFGTLSGSNPTPSNNVSITATNRGTNNATAAGGHTIDVGYVASAQCEFGEAVLLGDNFTAIMTNVGIDSSASTGSSSVGYILDGQLTCDDQVRVADNASFTASNTGINSCNGSESSVGNVNKPQLAIGGPFQAGTNLSINATNVGIDNSSTGSDNNIGTAQSPQIAFGDMVNIGSDATISATNSGTSSSSGTGNSTGCVATQQININGPFEAGPNLTMTATNDGTNTGDPSNSVGVIGEMQIWFQNTCTLDDGTLISAINGPGGFIAGDQIKFEEGFTVTSGTATIQALNLGPVGAVQEFGIFITGGTGGDANIVLENTSLWIASNEPTFTIGALNGNENSTVIPSQYILIIDTDKGVNADFAGAILSAPMDQPTTIVKGGLGTQILSGANTFPGLAINNQGLYVEQGTLVLNGSVASDVTVTAPGILAGIGTVAGDVFNTGTISPGQSIGTMTFLSNFTNNGGTYNAEINGAGMSDLIAVTGTATLNGGLVIASSADGTYKFNNRYTILTSSHRVGTYSGVTAISPFIQPVLTYDADNVYLTLTTAIVRAAETCNQLAVATLLDGITNPTTNQNLVLSAIVDLPLDEAQEALNNLTGYQYTDDVLTTALVNRQFIRRLYDPLRSLVTTNPDCYCYDPCDSCCASFTPWIEAGGTFAHLNNNGEGYGFNTKGYEITGGIQTSLQQEWTIGAAGSYEHDSLHYKGDAGSQSNKIWFAGLYGLYRPSEIYALVDFTYGHSCNKLHRNINAGAMNFSTDSKPKTSQYTFYGELGVDFQMCEILLQPFAGIEAGGYRRNSVVETGTSGMELSIEKHSRSFASARLGVHLTTYALADCVDLSLDVAWNRRLNNRSNTINAQFVDFGDSFTIDGTKLYNDSVDYALTASTCFCDNWRVYVEGSGESWQHGHLYNVLGGVTFTW